MQTVESLLGEHFGTGRDSLIPILQEIQDSQGYLSRDAVIEVGRHLGLPASKVYGVTAFYNQFRFQSLGKHHIQVCRGTACHVKGSAAVLEALKRTLGIEPGHSAQFPGGVSGNAAFDGGGDDSGVGL